MSLPSLKQPFVIGSIETSFGLLPKISSKLLWADLFGTIKARWGIGRMRYTIDPGLYALGEPDAKSPVLVTANYKMSFDKLREALPNRHAWILVLDTEGINVWCSAGKGTFGTRELVERIESSGLPWVVSHRELILPQLSGPGVSAHEVKRLSGFNVIYGPVRSKDLPAFLDSKFKATPEMRIKTFTTLERIGLIPMELVSALRIGLLIMPILFLFAGISKLGEGWTNAINHGIFTVVTFLSAIFVGSVLTPLLLPWLPGRSFSMKGLSLGLPVAILFTVYRWEHWVSWAGRLEIIAWFLLIPALSAYLAMNFTGASTFTSLSGVKKEMRWALPFQIITGGVGLLLWFCSQFIL